jgi:type II secretory pathway component GspD/PulD (secretin)
MDCDKSPSRFHAVLAVVIWGALFVSVATHGQTPSYSSPGQTRRMTRLPYVFPPPQNADRLNSTIDATGPDSGLLGGPTRATSQSAGIAKPPAPGAWRTTPNRNPNERLRAVRIARPTLLAQVAQRNKKSEGETQSPVAEPLPTPLPARLPSPPPPRSLVPNPTSAAKRFSFEFDGAPWDVVLKRFSKETGMSLQMGTIPEGTFHCTNAEMMDPDEALNLLNGQLIDAGYILLKRDGFLAVYSLDEEIPPSLIPMVGQQDLLTLPSNALVTLRAQIENGDAALLAKEIDLLISTFGGTDILTESNTLYVTDVVRNLRKISAVTQIAERDVFQRPMTVIRLNHTPADVVSTAINEFFGESSGVAGAAGRTTAGARTGGAGDSIDGAKLICVPEMTTNSLLINAQPRYFAAVKDLISRLDASPHQVVIKAMLVEVDLGCTNEFGVELGIQDSVLFDRSVVDDILTITETVTNGNIQTTDQVVLSQQGSPGFGFNNAPLGNNIAINPSRVGSQGLSNFSVGRINNETGFGGLVLSGGSESVSFLLRALAAKRDVSILSRPQIRTVHNKAGKIQIGQEVPVVDGVTITAVGNANPVIRQADAGIILEVTPRISPDGNVVVEVSAEKSAYRTGRGSGVPIFTDATSGNVIEAPIKDLTLANGTVSVKDGQTIVLGGMIGNQTVTSESKVPWLGDVPYVGRLFRHDLEQVIRKELLIFLTPTVLYNSDDAAIHDQHEMGLLNLPSCTESELIRLGTSPGISSDSEVEAGMIEGDATSNGTIFNAAEMNSVLELSP